MKTVKNTEGNLIEIQLPFGNDRATIVANFKREFSQGGLFSRPVNNPRDLSDSEIEQLLRPGFVLVVLASNSFSLENELHSFVVKDLEAWKRLSEDWMRPKVVFQLAMSSVDHLQVV